MARINTYPDDPNPSLNDKLLGSNFDDPEAGTVQFSVDSIRLLIDSVSAGTIVTSIYTNSEGPEDETNEGFFTTAPIDGVISTTTTININKTSSSGQDLSTFLQLLIDFVALPDTDLKVKIKNSGDNTKFGNFRVTNIVDNGLYVTMTVTIIENLGLGSFIDEVIHSFIWEFENVNATTVETVTGVNVDNADPFNPVVNGLTSDQSAAMEAANGPSALNKIATINDIPTSFGDVESVTGVNVDNTDSTNPVVNGLSSDQSAAMEASSEGLNPPTALNPIATMDDLPAAGGSVDSVSGTNVDNTDPANPVVNGLSNTQRDAMQAASASGNPPSAANRIATVDDLIPASTSIGVTIESANYTTDTAENGFFVKMEGGTQITLDSTGKTVGYNQVMQNLSGSDIVLVSSDTIEGQNNPIPHNGTASYVLTEEAPAVWSVVTPSASGGGAGLEIVDITWNALAASGSRAALQFYNITTQRTATGETYGKVMLLDPDHFQWIDANNNVQLVEIYPDDITPPATMSITEVLDITP